MRNIKLILEYDGTDFVGWQRQKFGRSVQSELENGLLKLIQEKVNVIGAGRTDSGVHARGQTANFRCESLMSVTQIKRGLAALLPDDVCVLIAEEVTLDFHARYSAKSRMYSYAITTQQSALLRKYSWFVKYELDFDLLKKCAIKIKESTDFKVFCRANSDVNHYMCNVLKSEWSMTGKYLRYEIESNRFLHGMVRSLVGSMVNVGRGYLELEDFYLNILLKNRNKIGQAAPACGLVLESVQY